MISMKRTYPYWGMIGFPTNEVAGLQEFARDFVIGFFEVQPRLWKQNKLSDDSKDFLKRMQGELTDLIDEKQVDEIMAWMPSWPFDRDLEI